MQEKKYNETTYYEEGQGPTLVLIHGLGADKEMFVSQIKYFEKDNRVIVPDLLGCGNSGKLMCSPQDILKKQISEINQLLESLGIEECVMLGISYGGVFIQEFAKYFPERLRAMIITDSFSRSTPYSKIEKLNYHLIRLSLWTYKYPTLLYLSSYPIYRKWPLANEYFKEAFKRLRSQETLEQRLAIMAIDNRSFLKEIDFPVYLLAGNYQKVLVKMAEETLKYLRIGYLEIIENSFDPSNLCAPEKFNELVKRILNDLRGD